MRVFLAIAAIAAALTTPAVAQTDRGASTRAFVNMCVARAQGMSNPEPTCACGAGVISGRMDDRQYTMMGRFAPHTGNGEAMRAEVRTMLDEGYSADEIRTVGQMLIDLEGPINSACRVLER